MTTQCPHCGRADTAPFEIVSRHTTTAGLTMWTRCHCGSLQVRVVDGSCVQVVSRGRPAA